MLAALQHLDIEAETDAEDDTALAAVVVPSRPALLPRPTERSLQHHKLLSRLMHAGKRQTGLRKSLVRSRSDLAQKVEGWNTSHAFRQGEIWVLPGAGGKSVAAAKRKGSGLTTSRMILPAAQLRLAFPAGPLGTCGQIAARVGCRPATVSYVIKGVAQALLLRQQAQLEEFVVAWRARSLLVLVEKVKWDETAQSVSAAHKSRLIGLLGRASTAVVAKRKRNAAEGRTTKAKPAPRQTHRRQRIVNPLRQQPFRRRRVQGNAEQIIVQRRWLSFIDANGRWFLFPFVVAPRLISGTSHDVLAAALKAGEPFCNATLSECVEVFWMIRESDAATANLKVVAAERSTLPKNGVFLHVTCLVHQLHLITGKVLSCVGERQGESLGYVSALFSTCMLLRSPGYFFRMLDRLEWVVRFFMLRHAGPPPRAAQQRSKDLLRLLGLQEDSAACRELLDVFNGNWEDTSALHHFCLGVRCCRDANHTVERMVRALRATVFACLPPIPKPARWTKVCLSLESFAFGFLLHNVYLKVYRVAFDSTFVHHQLVVSTRVLETITGPQVAKADAEDEMHESQFFRRVGVRLQRSRAFMQDATTPPVGFVILVALLPLQRLFHWFLRVAGDRAAKPTSPDMPVPLLDLLWEANSPVVSAQQVYGHLLCSPLGECSPLIWQAISGGSAPLTHIAKTTLRLVCEAGGGLQMRFTLPLSQWPVRLFGIVDRRL